MFHELPDLVGFPEMIFPAIIDPWADPMAIEWYPVPFCFRLDEFFYPIGFSNDAEESWFNNPAGFDVFTTMMCCLMRGEAVCLVQ